MSTGSGVCLCGTSRVSSVTFLLGRRAHTHDTCREVRLNGSACVVRAPSLTAGFVRTADTDYGYGSGVAGGGRESVAC